MTKEKSEKKTTGKQEAIRVQVKEVMKEGRDMQKRKKWSRLRRVEVMNSRWMGGRKISEVKKKAEMRGRTEGGRYGQKIKEANKKWLKKEVIGAEEGEMTEEEEQSKKGRNATQSRMDEDQDGWKRARDAEREAVTGSH